MIGVLIVAHDTLGDSLIKAVTHVLGARPPQFEAFSVKATDDPLALLPRARLAVQALDTGEGVLIFSDIYGATPCNLAVKLLEPGHVERAVLIAELHQVDAGQVAGRVVQEHVFRAGVRRVYGS